MWSYFENNHRFFSLSYQDKEICNQIWNDCVALPTSHIKMLPIGFQDFLLLQQLKNNLDINFCLLLCCDSFLCCHKDEYQVMGTIHFCA